MATRFNKPISVTLGPLAARAEARVRSGDYTSVSEVVREGLRALDREDAMMEVLLKKRIAELDDDPRDDIAAEQVFAEMDVFIAAYKAKQADAA